MVMFNKPKRITSFGIPLSESQILSGNHRISGGVDGVLTKLFNLICLRITNDNGIGPIQWNKLMIDYIRKVSNSKVAIDRTSIRGNLTKELRRPGMTWKTFCTKGLVFLKMDCFSFTIDAVFEDGTETSSTISAVLNADTPYRGSIPPDKYTNPQGRQPKLTRGGHVSKNTINYSSDAGSMLARMFNTICLDYTGGEGISELQWNTMLDEYIERYSGATTAAERQNARSKHKKEFRRGKMMWKVFCKGLQFLKIAKILITVKCIREDGLIVTVETPVVFRRMEEGENNGQ